MTQFRIDKLPQIISDDRSIVDGVTYLASTHAAVDILFARHLQTGDFGLPGEHEDTVRGGYSVVGIEGPWWTSADQKMLDDYRGGASLDALTKRFDATALRTVLAVGRSARTIVADVLHESESATGAILKQIRRDIGHLSTNACPEEIGHFAAYQHMREWCVLGALGMRMAESNVPKGLLVFGCGHQGLAPKLEGLGVAVTSNAADIELAPVSKVVTERIVAMSR